jgi:hypothetical protein
MATVRATLGALTLIDPVPALNTQVPAVLLWTPPVQVIGDCTVTATVCCGVV